MCVSEAVDVASRTPAASNMGLFVVYQLEKAQNGFYQPERLPDGLSAGDAVCT